MRVAVFTDTDFDRMSGARTSLQALVAHAPADVGPRIYTFADLEVDEPDFVAWRRTAAIRWRQLEKRLTADGTRVLHLTGGGTAGLAARGLALRMGLPLLGSVHAAVESAARRWLYRGCERVLMPSAAAARQAATDGWGVGRIVVWRRGVDAEKYSPVHRSLRLREAWHVSDRRPAILVAGRLAGEKGLALLEPLGALLHRQRVAHRFIVAGAGPMLPELQERCPDAYFTGRVADDELPLVMASADLLVYPSGTDTGCGVVLEAQASGVPVLVTNVGSARENMRPGRTGYVCRSGDVAELAARAAALLVDRGHRQELGEAARQYALSRTWDASLTPVYELYRAAGEGRLPQDPRLERGGAWRFRALAASVVSSLRHRRWAGHR
jgi:glycosyltransferase involved in cell wall biosynthesis